jgi:DNA-binding CsgD family transcriptional regulator
MAKPYDKSQWQALVIGEWVAGKDYNTIATALGCNQRTVGDYIKAHATPEHVDQRATTLGTRRQKYYSKYVKLQTLRPLLIELHKKKHTMGYIAQSIGISERSVREYMDTLRIRKIKRREKPEAQRPRFRSFDPLQVRSMLRNLGYNA